jgi:hypothetical protein
MPVEEEVHDLHERFSRLRLGLCSEVGLRSLTTAMHRDVSPEIGQAGSIVTAAVNRAGQPPPDEYSDLDRPAQSSEPIWPAQLTGYLICLGSAPSTVLSSNPVGKWTISLFRFFLSPMRLIKKPALAVPAHPRGTTETSE